jgi:hypothetical protein
VIGGGSISRKGAKYAKESKESLFVFLACLPRELRFPVEQHLRELVQVFAPIRGVLAAEDAKDNRSPMNTDERG